MKPISGTNANNFIAVTSMAGVFVAACLLVIFFSSLPVPGASKPAVRQEANKTNYGDQRVAVLLFHAVDYHSANPNTMSLADLEATFQALKDCGYKPIHLEQFHAFIEGRASVPPKAVLLTFDDGYRDIFESIYPLTKKFNYPAVVFAITKWFDLRPRPEPSRQHLNVAEAGVLLKSGLWSIGGHSYEGHHRVTGANNFQGPYYVTRAWKGVENRLESEAEYKARVWSDISLDRAALKRAGVSEPLDFAYPYGAFNSDVVKMLNEAGYIYLYMNEPGLNKAGQDPSYIRRISAGRSAHETMALLGWYFSRK